MPPKAFLLAIRESLGVSCGHFLVVGTQTRAQIAQDEGFLRPSCGLLGASWWRLGASCNVLRRLGLDPLQICEYHVLKCHGRRLGWLFGGLRAYILDMFGRWDANLAPDLPRWGFLGASWGLLGASWRRFGASGAFVLVAFEVLWAHTDACEQIFWKSKNIENQDFLKILGNGGGKNGDVSRETYIFQKKCRTVDAFVWSQFCARRPQFWNNMFISRQSHDPDLRFARAGAIKNHLRRPFLSHAGHRDPMQHAKICTALWRELDFDAQILKNHRFFNVFVLATCTCTVNPAKLRPILGMS